MWWHRIVDARCAVCRTRGTFLCPHCVRDAASMPRSMTLDGVAVRALGLYTGTLRSVIRAAKNQHARAIMGEFRRQFRQFAAHIDVDVPVVPIPASTPGMRRRGYGLADDIGLMLGRTRVDALRLLDRGTQRGRGATERQRERRIAARPAGDRVILVDDVITTGATIRVAIRALREVGTDVVLVIVAGIVPTPLASRP